MLSLAYVMPFEESEMLQLILHISLDTPGLPKSLSLDPKEPSFGQLGPTSAERVLGYLGTYGALGPRVVI